MANPAQGELARTKARGNAKCWIPSKLPFQGWVSHELICLYHSFEAIFTEFTLGIFNFYFLDKLLWLVKSWACIIQFQGIGGWTLFIAESE